MACSPSNFASQIMVAPATMDVGGHEQPVGVKDRQRVDQPVLTGIVPAFQKRRDIRGKVAMGQNRPLGTPRRPRGVKDRRMIGRSARHPVAARAGRQSPRHQAAIGIRARFDPQAVTFPGLVRGQRRGGTDKETRRGIAQKIVDLRPRYRR